jgi:uncharacterized protein with PQ loop repeat
MMPNVLGWFSSLVLLITLGQQVMVQWKCRKSTGVSIWLFVGQFISSAGFALYSYLLGNWVFLCTNLALLANAGIGQWVTVRNRRLAAQSSPRSAPAE